MKKTIFAFLLIAIMSCGTSQPIHSRATVQFRDSVISDFYLFSVRDSSVMIAPYSNEYISLGSLLVSAKEVSFDKIEKIVMNGNRTFLSVALPGIVGCTAGYASTQNGAPIFSSGGVGPSPSRLQPYATVGGFIAGFLIGWFATSDKEFILAHPDDVKALKIFYSIYPTNEPPELQKIK